MFFGARPKLISFEDARAALLTLLGDVGEEFWREKLAGVSRDSFGRILGGMGSFTDLVICRENNHQITEEKEPLANQLLSCLTSVCYVTSKRGAVNPVEAVAACGTTGLVLSGWRCLVCGYSQVSHYNIRGFLAAIGVREALRVSIDEALGLWKGDENEENLRAIISSVSESGIHPTEYHRFMRPCPSCKGEDTCVYGWQLEGGLFVPTADNLRVGNG